ncbi:MAG TPA: Clp protease N-terminal domain-containing protein [Symbiobacteriaceae bacterium]|nr:Clp protease N-terminal domain-containing protein [Symbiobacteriaceae bacterium]
MPSYTPAVAGVVKLAQREAKRLGYPFIQREQLLLGLLLEESVSRILTDLGLDLQSTRQAVEEALLPGLGAPDDPEAIGMLPTAEQVCRQRAQTAATLVGHTHIGPEHILLGFLLEQHGAVLEVLTSLGVTKEKVMDAIKRLDK